LTLSIAVLALVVAWLIRPRSLEFDSDNLLPSAVGAIGVLMALSALPLPSSGRSLRQGAERFASHAVRQVEPDA
jgi:hypothetical protein